ncbi:MAG: hypothetical protein V4472_04170 [Pseudomonadota bacterium]
MAEQTEPTEEPASSIESSQELGVAANDIAAEPEALTSAPALTTGERFLRLFEQLHITRVVLVDDRLDIPLDAALATRIFSDKEEAQEAGAAFFPDVVLNDDNEHVFDQVEAILATMDADRRAELATVLARFDERAADVNVARDLTDLLPADFPTEYLTPNKWTARRDELLVECTATSRTLFLFDQQLGAQGNEGTTIITELVAHDRAAFGTRWFCALLSHTLQKGEEIQTWRKLADDENLALALFMPIAKGNLSDGNAFYGAVYRTVINIYAEQMKKVALDAFKEAMASALDEFSNFDPIDFEHAVAKSSEGEGVSELETLMRLFTIVQRDRIKRELLKEEQLGAFLDAAHTAREIADVGRSLSDEATRRLAKLRHSELYEAGDLINEFRDPLRNGDLFEIGSGDKLSMWVLIAQPCDLMVRSDGKRTYEKNFKVAVLAPVTRKPLGDEPEIKPYHEFKLERLDHDGLQAGSVVFTKATPVSLHVLDLVVLRADGVCEIDSNDADPFPTFSSMSWDNRAPTLRRDFKAVADKIEDVRSQRGGDHKAKTLAGYLMPRAAPGAVIAQHAAYDKGRFSYAIKRTGRVREPFASSLLAAFSRYLSRDAYEHDFSVEKVKHV